MSLYWVGQDELPLLRGHKLQYLRIYGLIGSLRALADLGSLKKLCLVVHGEFTFDGGFDHLPIEELTIYTEQTPPKTLPRALARLGTLTNLTVHVATVPEWISEIASLCELQIHGNEMTAYDHIARCTMLNKLTIVGTDIIPTTVGALYGMPNLTTLVVFKCDNTVLPSSLGDLAMLATLTINNCIFLTLMPDAICRLRNLKTLHVEDCPQVTCLPDGIVDLPFLEMITLVRTGMTAVPEVLDRLHALRHVRLTFHDATFASGPPSTRMLYISEMPITSLADMPELETLDLWNCTICDSATFGDIPRLTVLRIWHTLIDIEMIAGLAHLTTLHLNNAGVSTIPDSICNLHALRELGITRSSVTTLPARFLALEKLSLVALSNFRVWPLEFSSASTLRHLNLARSSVSVPAWFESNSNWTHVVLPPTVTRWPANMIYLCHLTVLDCSDCAALTSLPDGPVSLGSLTELSLSRCTSLTALPRWIGDLCGLQTLDLSYCKRLTALPCELGRLWQLEHLVIPHVPLATLPASLVGLRSVGTITLQHSHRLEALPPVLAELLFVPLHISQGLQACYWLPQLFALVLAGRRGNARLPSEIWCTIWQQFQDPYLGPFGATSLSATDVEFSDDDDE